MGGAGGEYEVIVFELGTAAEVSAATLHVEVRDLIHEDKRVGGPQDCADRLGNVGCGEHSHGDLIEQRLKGVVILAVDNGDVDIGIRELHGRIQAGKACADDEHPLSRTAGQAVVRGHETDLPRYHRLDAGVRAQGPGWIAQRSNGVVGRSSPKLKAAG